MMPLNRKIQIAAYKKIGLVLLLLALGAYALGQTTRLYTLAGQGDQQRIKALLLQMQAVAKIAHYQARTYGYYPTVASALVSRDAYLTVGGNTGNIIDEDNLKTPWQFPTANIKIKNARIDLGMIYNEMSAELHERDSRIIYTMRNFPADRPHIAETVYRRCNFFSSEKELEFVPGGVDPGAHICGYTADATGVRSIDYYIAMT